LRRVELLTELRAGRFDVLVGINLLREGLDLPEVSLVAVFDADKQGFLRSATSLIQTIGRAARNVSGEVHLYADRETDAMKQAIGETNRRRATQVAYNLEHGIDPTPIRKRIADITETLAREVYDTEGLTDLDDDVEVVIDKLTEQMIAAAEELKFELAARLRDEIHDLKKQVRSARELGKP
jgi:excinuclease ABC subunit B